MENEVKSIPDHPAENKDSKPKINRYERHRLIAHLGRTFARRYDIQVLPSRQKGLWACSLDPKINVEVHKYIDGKRDTLDDLPPEAFVPYQILYDAEAAEEMSMDEINTILHHEAGHAKYTDFRLMFEGQRQARDEGYLPTSFWLMFEGIEDPRVNNLEGEESPAIDRQIKTNQGNDLQKRLTEMPITDRPAFLQLAYNSFHYWLKGEPIKELENTEVGILTETAKPLLQQYFQNTDIDERKILQKQIWDIVKDLEKQEVENEEIRQMAKNGQQNQKSSGQSQPGGEGQLVDSSGPSPSSEQQETQQGIPTKKHGIGELLYRLKNSFEKDEEEKTKEKFDLSTLSEKEIEKIKESIENMSPEDKAKLTKIAKEIIDEAQKQALEEELSKILKFKKNKKTDQYEVELEVAEKDALEESENDYNEALQELEAEEQAEFNQLMEEKRIMEEKLEIEKAQRREKEKMQKQGFDENERDKFLLYQSLEDSMYTFIRNFKQAIEKVIPRKKEPIYESGYFSGPKFDRYDLVKKAPLGNEQFWRRQIEAATGEPRLFIGLLVDNSMSMSGKKIEEARKTMIFFAKVAHDMGIPFMASAFGQDAEVIKAFKQDFDNPSEKIKPKIIDATDASDDSTNLFAGIKITIGAMNEKRRIVSDSHGLIFVITDGGANAGLTGTALKSYIEENRGRLTFKAFGLSGSQNERNNIQNYLNDYFGEGNCAYPEGFEDLPNAAFRLLRINLMQFQKFLR